MMIRSALLRNESIRYRGAGKGTGTCATAVDSRATRAQKIRCHGRIGSNAEQRRACYSQRNFGLEW